MTVRLIFTFSLTILVLCIVWAIANWKHLVVYPNIISSYYAKEYCSCFFVTELDEESCHTIVKQWIPIQSFTLNKENKTVLVKGLWQINSAEYLDEKTGCRLVDEQ